MKTRNSNIEASQIQQTGGGCCGPAPEPTVSTSTSPCCGSGSAEAKPQVTAGACCV